MLWQELEHTCSRAWEGTAVQPLLPTALSFTSAAYGFQKGVNYNSVELVIALISSISLLPAPDRQFQSTDCSRKSTFIHQWLTEKLCFPPRRKLPQNYCKCKYLFLLSLLAYDLTYAFGDMLSSSHASGSHVHPICFIPKHLNLLCLQHRRPKINNTYPLLIWLSATYHFLLHLCPPSCSIPALLSNRGIQQKHLEHKMLMWSPFLPCAKAGAESTGHGWQGSRIRELQDMDDP